MTPITKKLKNGVRFILVPMRDNSTVTALVLTATGSKYETKDRNGISHFLEHLCFKGTEKRIGSFALASELDQLGAEYNAFTSQEYTGYYAKADRRHVTQLIDVVSDIYQNAIFSDEDIAKEKGVIVEEINMYEDMPHRKVQDIFMELVYGDQPAGWGIAGTKDRVLSFEKKDFLEYRHAHYVPSSTVVVVAGGIDPKKTTKDIENFFGAMKKSPKQKKIATSDSQSKPHVKIFYKDTDQAHFVLGVRAFPLGDKRNSALAVLSGILSGGMSSRLFQKVREEMGAGYYVRAVPDLYTDHGVFQISAGVDVKRIQEVIAVILQECKKIATEEISKKEMEKVKEYICGGLNTGIETSDQFASFYGDQEILKNKFQTPKEKERNIRAVTSAQVQKIAREIFITKNLNLAVVGPYKDSREFEKGLSF